MDTWYDHPQKIQLVCSKRQGMPILQKGDTEKDSRREKKAARDWRKRR